MRPMDQAPLLIPFVLTLNPDRFPNLQVRNPRCQIYIVSDQQGQARGHTYDKALVGRTVSVIGKYALYPSLGNDNQPTLLSLVCRVNRARWALTDPPY